MSSRLRSITYVDEAEASGASLSSQLMRTCSLSTSCDEETSCAELRCSVAAAAAAASYSHLNMTLEARVATCDCGCCLMRIGGGTGTVRDARVCAKQQAIVNAIMTTSVNDHDDERITFAICVC